MCVFRTLLSANNTLETLTRCVISSLPLQLKCRTHCSTQHRRAHRPRQLGQAGRGWVCFADTTKSHRGSATTQEAKSGCHTSGGVTHTVTRTRSGPCSPHRTTPVMPALGVRSGVANADDLGIGASVASSPQRLRRLQDWVVHEHPQHTWCRMWPEQLRATQPEAQARFLSMVATTRHRQHSTHLVRGRSCGPLFD